MSLFDYYFGIPYALYGATQPEKIKEMMYEAMEREASAASKYDSSKTPLNLLDPSALEGLGAVLAFGAEKYSANNWKKGLSYSRIIASMLRHIFAIMKGEYIDPESNLPHIDHVGANWMFLSYFMKNRTDLDDLKES